ncbi:MAG: 30S ribosomal protein S12 methylthiotransferase RimO [Planctomycetes bacterium]|nr:30S ribosomal protein S12 methylthiotransferase RimO [Planctomycetota bacterium]
MHLGCARNLIDSEVMLARMAEQGCVVSGALEDADVGIVNTCSFIGPARAESEGVIRDLIERKRRGELRAVVVAGCLVQRYRHALVSRFPEVDLFAEISDYSALAGAVRDLGRHVEGPRYLAAGGLREPEREGARLLATPGSYAYLRISLGCDHTCAFCAIPSIRGPHRSKRPEAVLDEARELIGAGVKELVLVAEDSTAWGRDIGSELPALVEALAELDGPHQVRIMYAYPHHFPWGLVPLLRDHPRVVKYLDIPVQHVSTSVLRAMRRAGSGDAVRAILDRLLSEVPGITLRTTLLLGYPGETEADVRELIEFVRTYRLGRLGAFPYSPEEGTHGNTLVERVPAEVIERRLAALFAARDEVLRASQQALVGNTLEVLVDELHGEHAIARTAMDAPEVDLVAEVRGCKAPVGARIRVGVAGLDGMANLVCRPAQAARAKDRRP